MWGLLLGLLMAALAAWADPAHLSVLADPRAGLADWSLRQVTAVPESAGVCLGYPAWHAGAGKWPSAVLTCGQGGFRESDWSRYERLVFRLGNRSWVPAPVRLRLDDAQGRRAQRSFVIGAQQERDCVVETEALARELDITRVVRFDLFLRQPVTDYQIELGPLRLEADAPSPYDVRLEPDPFGQPLARVRARAGRSACVEVHVTGPAGAAGAWSACTDRLDWTWRGSAPGRYRATLIVADSAWGGEPVTRELGAFDVLPEPEQPDLVAWVEPAARKVRLDDRPTADAPAVAWSDLARGAGPVLRLDLARNEAEATQLVLLARAQPAELQVALSGLVDPVSGARLEPQQQAVQQVGYVFTRDPLLYAVEAAGWWPDALLPAAWMRAAPGECMPVWIQVRTEAETPPGLYRGRLTLRQRDGQTGWLPVEVRVRSVVVPDSSSVRTAFSLGEAMLRQVYGAPLPDGLLRRYQDMVADHRLNVDQLYRTEPPRLDDLARLAAQHRLNAVNLLHVRRDVAWDDAALQALAGRLDPVVAAMRQAGLVSRAYVYGFDEVEPDAFDTLRRVFGFLKQRYPDVRTATTAREPTLGVASGLDDVVDIWVPPITAFDSTAAAAARARGHEVWWYVSIDVQHPHANWFVEYPALEARLLWWMTYQQGLDGFLYYTLNRWPQQRRPLAWDGGNRTTWNPASFQTANGDGCLLYPGPHGPLASVRLEMIRDGLEDVELLRLLGGPQAAALCRRLVESPTHYARDPADLQRVRTELLDLLEARAAPR